MSTKRIIASVITFLVALIAFGLAFQIYKNVSDLASEEKSNEAEKSEETPKSLPPLKEAQVIPVINKTIQSDFSVQGRLRSYDKTDLVAEIPGMMRPMNKRFKVGTSYTKDEVIFEVDDSEARLSIQAQKAQLITAITLMLPDMKIDMPNSYQNWSNYLKSFNVKQSIRSFPTSLSERETYYVASKGLLSQYYNIKSAELRLTKYQVRAPFNGILTQANVGDSGYLRAGVPLGTIMNTTKYELEAAIPMSDLKYVKVGRSVKVVSDDTGKSWTGRVKRIGDLVDATTQTAIVFISVEGNHLREGQYLRAIINTKSSIKGIEIPRNLVINNENVLIVEDSIITLVPVQIAKVEDEKAVVQGLKENSLLITDRMSVSMEGQKVIPVQ